MEIFIKEKANGRKTNELFFSSSLHDFSFSDTKSNAIIR